MKTVILFASGSGSNVENIVNYFREKQIEINLELWVKAFLNKAGLAVL